MKKILISAASYALPTWQLEACSSGWRACQAACTPNFTSNKIRLLFNSGVSGDVTNFADN
jgi:hypothetical protein